MWKLRNITGAGQRAVALDFGADATRLLVLAPNRDGGFRRSACCTLPTVDLTHEMPGHVAESLSDRVRELGLRGATCRVTLCSEAFRSDTACLPAMTDDELRASARFEALDRFGVDPSEFALQHVAMAGQSTGGRQVLLLAAHQALVRRATEAVMACGLVPVSVEHAVLAALRGLERWNGGTQSGLVACLHLEPRVATLALLQDGCLTHLRCMKGDWQSMATPPQAAAVDADAIALEPVEPASRWRWSCLAEETLRCLRQVCGEQSWPARMVVSGAAGDPGLLEALGGVCGASAEHAGSGTWVGGEQAVAGESWASALGAACLDMRRISGRRAA